MEAKISIYGFLTEDVTLFDNKNQNQNKNGRMTVAVNRDKNDTEYYTVFEYNISDKRAKLLKKGTFVQVYGILQINTFIKPDVLDNIQSIKDTSNTNTEQAIEILKKFVYINKTILAKDFEIIYSKS